MTVSPQPIVRTWTRPNFLMSTDSALVDIKTLGRFFRTPELGWTVDVSSEAKQALVNNSLCFGIYYFPDGVPEGPITPDTPRQMVGFSRIITDYVTLAYLADVVIDYDFQKRGLASWMMKAVDEVCSEMPNFRYLSLITIGGGHTEQLYNQTMGAFNVQKRFPSCISMVRAGPMSNCNGDEKVTQ